MVKADIIRSIELKLDLSHEEAALQVEQILTILKDQLADGEPVLISGFGQWKVREKNTRIGRNPITREEYQISPRRVVTFYPSNVWREEISNNSGPKIGG
jgi:integration host factor subunit alpha